MKALFAAILFVTAIGSAMPVWPQAAPVYSITASKLPIVVAKLYGLPVGKFGTWVVFFFHAHGDLPQDDAVNLQYSVENGVVGLDWVLLSRRNVADKKRLIAFINAKGFNVSEMEMNNVRYLRVEGNGIEQLGVKIVTKFYGIAPSAPVQFYTEGFEWAKT